MSFKDFIQGFVTTSKDYIQKFEQYKDLSGEEKKARVDDIVKSYVEGAIDTLGLNFIAKFIIKKVLIENIPTITQCIFDLIASKVQGITK